MRGVCLFNKIVIMCFFYWIDALIFVYLNIIALFYSRTKQLIKNKLNKTIEGCGSINGGCMVQKIREWDCKQHGALKHQDLDRLRMQLWL